MKKPNRKPKYIILSIAYLIMAVVFAAMIIWLNVLPKLYLISGLILMAVGSVLIVLFVNVRKEKSRRRIAGTIIAAVFIVLYAIGTYYIYSTQDLFAKITTIGQATEDYYVITRADDDETTMDTLAGKNVYVFDTGAQAYEDAMTRLDEIVDVEFEKVSGLYDMEDMLKDGKCQALLLSNTYYDMLCEDDSSFEMDNQIIYTLTVNTDVESVSKSVSEITSNPFNVYISGIDVFGSINEVSRSDVNIVMTVNPKDKVILLTSMPRDSYVTLHSIQQMDKLTHAGVYGIEESISTIEDMFNTEINYYIRVNFSTVVDIIDAIGGITVESDYTFTTSGRDNNGYHFEKGTNDITGEEALAFSRERHSFEDGDFQRNRNQQIVLEALLDKVLSSETLLTKYTQLLDVVEDEMQINMKTSEIQDLVKMQIGDMASWRIFTQSVEGVPGSEYCYSLGGAASIVHNDTIDLAKAARKIQLMMDGAEQADGEWTIDFE